MSGQHLLKNVRISRLSGKADFLKASTIKDTRAVDMMGFEGCMFIAVAGTSAGRGATTKTVMIIKGCSSTGGTFYKLHGSSSTALWTTGTLNYKVHVIDVFRPLSTNRHLRASVLGCSTGQLDCVLAIQYGTRTPGSTDMWKSSTYAGSTRWKSTQLAAQVLLVSATATTKTTAV